MNRVCHFARTQRNQIKVLQEAEIARRAAEQAALACTRPASGEDIFSAETSTKMSNGNIAVRMDADSRPGEMEICQEPKQLGREWRDDSDAIHGDGKSTHEGDGSTEFDMSASETFPQEHEVSALDERGRRFMCETTT